MEDTKITLKKNILGAHKFVQKSEEEIKKDIATQELASRLKMKGVTNGSKENNKEV